MTAVITAAHCMLSRLWALPDESWNLVYMTVVLYDDYHLKTLSYMNTLHMYVKKRSQDVFVVLTDDIGNFL